MRFLHFVSREGSLKEVKKLLSEPFMDVEQLGRQNRSSLANAALRGDDELVKLLLRHNATPESKYAFVAKTGHGQEPGPTAPGAVD